MNTAREHGGRQPCALITRPLPEAQNLAAALAIKGWDSIMSPVLTVAFKAGQPLSLDDIQAIIATSANGVRGLALRTVCRDKPLFVVGDHTAQAAQAAGFTVIHNAKGRSADVVTLLRAHNMTGPLLHACGQDVAPDAFDNSPDLSLRRVVLYETVPAPHLSPTAIAALQAQTLTAALFFSPRSAAIFQQLAQESGLLPCCASVHARCLSPAVAAIFPAGQWRSLDTAAHPTQADLLAKLPPLGR